MKSKKLNKKCRDCLNYNGCDCTHKSNLGIRVQYRQEYTYYIKKAEELNAQSDCKNYVQA